MTPVIVTDSSACVPGTWHRHPALRVLPLVVLLPQGRLDDGEAAGPALAALADGEPVRTAAPSPVDYLRAVDDAPGGAVVVTPAARVAVMHRNAALAARLAAGGVQVVDTATAGPAHGLCVLAGLRAVEAGADSDAVARAVRRAADGVQLVAVVPDLARVATAVRRDPASSWAAGRTRAATFRFLDGVPVPLPAAGGDPLDAVVAAWESHGGPGAGDTVVFHTQDPTGAAALRARIDQGDGAGGTTVDVVPISPAMAVHTGPGCLGVAWLAPGP